jgi:hypothetical protein
VIYREKVTSFQDSKLKFCFIQGLENKSHVKSWPLTTTSPTYWWEKSDAHCSQPSAMHVPCLHSGPPWKNFLLWLKVREIPECKIIFSSSFYHMLPNSNLPGFSTKLSRCSIHVYRMNEWMNECPFGQSCSFYTLHNCTQFWPWR